MFTEGPEVEVLFSLVLLLELLFDGGELSSSDGGDAAEKRLLENKKITRKTSLFIALK